MDFFAVKVDEVTFIQESVYMKISLQDILQFFLGDFKDNKYVKCPQTLGRRILIGWSHKTLRNKLHHFTSKTCTYNVNLYIFSTTNIKQ